MGFVGNLMSATGAAITAFSERMLNADPADSGAGGRFAHASWGRFESRYTRYDLYWGLYQNNAYRDLVHHYAAKFKTTQGVSKSIRHLYNPAYRLGEFFAGHLMGGMLDDGAGDGEAERSALPILTDNEAIRPAVARLRKDSSWQVKKEVLSRWGAVMGDVAVRIVDDPIKGQVRKELVHPSHLRWVDFDGQGCVKGYVLRKWMPDPRKARSLRDLAPGTDPMTLAKPVVYEERAFRDGDLVVYQTFLDERPYPWNGEKPEWTEDYGFVPLVVCQHESIGLDWGQNCFHAGLSRFLEVDDQASCVGDGNRKDLHAPHLMVGMKSPGDLKQGGADRATRTPQENAAEPEPSRTEKGFVYSTNKDARAYSLVHRRDLAGIVEHIRGLLDDVEKNYPELLADTGNLGGTVTAEAIRNARQRASAKVQARRVGYFHAEVRSNQMALAIGGYRGYEGYEGFDLDSYADGKLDHAIGHTPVFEVDPLDSIEEDQAFWTAAGLAVAAGVPLAVYLERNGWSEEELASLATAKQAEDAKALALAKATAPEAGPGGKAQPTNGATK